MHRYSLTAFDKLGASICWLGSGILILIHVLVVRRTHDTYYQARLIDGFAGRLTTAVYSPGYVISSVMLMIFMSYYALRIRRMYDAQSASNILFLGIVISVLANILQIYALYAPATSSIEMMPGGY